MATPREKVLLNLNYPKNGNFQRFPGDNKNELSRDTHGNLWIWNPIVGSWCLFGKFIKDSVG